MRTHTNNSNAKSVHDGLSYILNHLSDKEQIIVSDFIKTKNELYSLLEKKPKEYEKKIETNWNNYKKSLAELKSITVHSVDKSIHVVETLENNITEYENKYKSYSEGNEVLHS
jgi:hypothetical protein